MRRWLLLDSFLVFVTGIQCFILAEHTDDFFAWTINPPLTAAFLGASYWAALPLVWLSAREMAWAQARIAVFGVLVFTAVTTVATLMHLDKFHLDSSDEIPLMSAWAWLAVYAAVPPSLAVLIIRQQKAPAGDPARIARLPSWMRVTLVAQSAAMLVAGVVLFVAPEADWWPWTLTPLTGRALAAWPLGIGLTLAHAAWEDDWSRLRPVMVSYVVLGALQLVNLLRFDGTVQWEEPGATLYAAFLAGILIVGVFGVTRAFRVPAPAVAAN